MSASPAPEADHRPTAALDRLKARAAILRQLRGFFHDRGVLEVETPLLCAAGSVDEHLEPIAATVHGAAGAVTRYLMTSPEHAMKRLLASGSGPIYQLTRAFRDGERGRLHNPEFTLLEWYRPGFDTAALMDEVEDLVAGVLGRSGAAPLRPFERVTYRDAFLRAAGVDPHQVAPPGGHVDPGAESLLNELLATRVEPQLGRDRPAFLTHYPASQASSGLVGPGPVARRFELYVGGVELANGYEELDDPVEQRRRYEQANARRAAAGRRALPIDERLLAALRCGLPAGAGVALGVDRLVMVALGAGAIDEVMAFPMERA